MTDLPPWSHICSYCDLGHPCVRDETPKAQEKRFVISDDEKEELVSYNQRGDRGESGEGHSLRMDERGLASLLLTQFINPALLAAEFRAKQEGQQ